MAKKDAVPKVPRVTGKMLNVLMDPEIRTICTKLLGITSLQAWSSSQTDRTNWVLAHLDVFKDADLSTLDWDMFRAPVKDYLEGLQLFIRGVGPAPTLDPLMGEPELKIVAYSDPEVWARDDETIAEDDDNVSVEEAKEELQMAVAVSRFKAQPVVPSAGKVAAPAAPAEPDVAEEKTDTPSEQQQTTQGKSTPALYTIDDFTAELKALRAGQEAFAAQQTAFAAQQTKFYARQQDFESLLLNIGLALTFIVNRGFVADGEAPFPDINTIADAVDAEEAAS